MTASHLFFVHFAFVQLLLCTLLLIPHVRHNLSAALFAVLTACGCLYVLPDLPIAPQLDPIGTALSFVGGNILPGVFWLVSLTVFGNTLTVQRRHYALAAVPFAIPLLRVALAQLMDLPSHPALYGMLTHGGMLLELVLITHALWIAITHWRDDLVEERRVMRGSVIGFIAAYLAIVIVVEQVLGIRIGWVDEAKFVGLSILATGVNMLFFSLRSNTLFASSAPVAVEHVKPVVTPTHPDVARIVKAMEQDKMYRQDGITISQLSRHLGIHEYKLRQLINGELNYRNFNDFLNHYRITEVATQLRDTQNKQVPILTLALDSGFRSLSSFNKAFKDKYGVTPTEYRHLGSASAE